MNVLFAGGGTGGHIYPGIAIADALRARGANVLFVGSATRLEGTIVPNAGYRLERIASRPFARRSPWTLLGTAAANIAGIVQAMRALSRFKPDVIIATGGYVCFPVVVAAMLLRIRPIALLEPNAHAGLTNRMLSPLVDEVWGAASQPDARFAAKYVMTGIPVRAELRALPPREEALARLGLSPARRTLLAMGGSQGARSINDALTSLVTSGGLPAGWQLIHVTGEREYDRVRAALDPVSSQPAVRPYLNDVSDAYAAADLVLARAGASTLGELAAIGRPAILIPYPYAADDHQRANAEMAAQTGAAVVMSDRDLQAGRLRAVVAELAIPARFEQLRAAAERLRSNDPLATILARVDALVARKNRS